MEKKYNRIHFADLLGPSLLPPVATSTPSPTTVASLSPIATTATSVEGPGSVAGGGRLDFDRLALELVCSAAHHLRLAEETAR